MQHCEPSGTETSSVYREGEKRGAASGAPEGFHGEHPSLQRPKIAFLNPPALHIPHV